MNTLCRAVRLVWYICPHLRVSFLADSNSCYVNRKPKLRTVRQTLRVLNQLAYGNVVAQPSVFFQLGD